MGELISQGGKDEGCKGSGKQSEEDSADGDGTQAANGSPRRLSAERCGGGDPTQRATCNRQKRNMWGEMIEGRAVTLAPLTREGPEGIRRAAALWMPLDMIIVWEFIVRAVDQAQNFVISKRLSTRYSRRCGGGAGERLRSAAPDQPRRVRGVRFPFPLPAALLHFPLSPRSAATNANAGGSVFRTS